MIELRWLRRRYDEPVLQYRYKLLKTVRGAEECEYTEWTDVPTEWHV